MNAIELNRACTYATPGEVDWLIAEAKKIPVYASVMMIGAGPGVMAVALLEGNPKIALTIVDKTSCQYVKAHISQMDIEIVTSVTYYEMDSATLGNQNRTWFDFLVIDGDHSYEGVKRDLDAWLKHVKPGGLVFLHDYDADGTCFADVERYPGVKQAVEECSAHWEEFCQVGTAIVFKML